MRSTGDGDSALGGAPELEAALASFVKDNRLPGGAAGVVHGDELVWSAEVGFADVAARKVTEPATLYAIASIHQNVYRDGHHAALRRWPPRFG